MADNFQSTRALQANKGSLTIQPFVVKTLSGPGHPAAFTCNAQECSIGTNENNQLQIDDATISRHHCTIIATDDGYLLKDLNSTNGTRVGGLRLREGLLEPGTSFSVGNTTLEFLLEGDEQELELSKDAQFGAVLGSSPLMRRLYAVLPKIAASKAAVLLEGETGTGKTLLASAIHEQSSRSDSPFVVLDCSAIPPNLIESELFGHLKGSFTGATKDREGVFVASAGGTLFLDEIGELPIELQAKLLRALEEKSVRPVGSDTPVAFDSRVLAATNRDLRESINRGGFGADLYYRLATVRLTIPALRERKSDIPTLVRHFWAEYSEGETEPVDAELINWFQSQDWPGNIRELRGAVERALIFGHPAWELGDSTTGVHESEVALGSAGAIGMSAKQCIEQQLSYRPLKKKLVAQWERTFISDALSMADNNIKRAAESIKLDKYYMYQLLRKHGLDNATSKDDK